VPGRREWEAAEDRELEALALAGGRDAWGELARRHTRRVVVALLARGATLELAEDVTQEAWLRLIMNQQAGRLASVSLPGLAIAQADWLLRERRRTEARRDSLAGPAIPLTELDASREPAAMSPDPASVVVGQDRLERVWTELQRCPPRARAVFHAVYSAAGRSQNEVADEMGLSLQRVRRILCEVRARLRSALLDAEREDET
jgi:RNA polymerase sigma-70 factor (ECF subfamily)